MQAAEKQSKFSYPAEVLPNNANTAKILKEREEKEAARVAKEQQVRSTFLFFCRAETNRVLALDVILYEIFAKRQFSIAALKVPSPDDLGHILATNDNLTFTHSLNKCKTKKREIAKRSVTRL